MFRFFRRPKEEPKEVEQQTEQALEKTRETGVFGQIGKLFDIDDLTDEFFDQLQKLMVQADLGPRLTDTLIERMQRRVLAEDIKRSRQVERILQEEMIRLLTEVQQKAEAQVARKREQGIVAPTGARPPLKNNKDKRPVAAPPVVQTPEGKQPYVILVVGVNGSGKTTTIAKLADYYKKGQAQVILGAADTFRAAAVEQLQTWGERIGVPVVAKGQGTDPGAVAYETMDRALAEGADVAIIDTAGRLQNKIQLMDELKRISQIMKKRVPTAPHEVLLVLDATTGQNGLSQAKAFTDTVGIDAIVLTKLDGTAKGGIAFAIANEMGIPIKYIGTGERPENFAEFDPTAYVHGLFRRPAERR